MEDLKQHLSDISEMRSIMDRSTRFLSLSGLSGIAAGIFALIGAAIAYMEINRYSSWMSQFSIDRIDGSYSSIQDLNFRLFIIASGVLVCALVCAYYLTWRKAKKNNQKLFTPVSRKMIYNMLVPLSVGGIFCLILMYYGILGLVAPCTLIFYGLACFSASQYTLTEVRYLGLLNIALGLANCFYPGYGLYFWAFGFGFLHILYGAVMYFRYDKKARA